MIVMVMIVNKKNETRRPLRKEDGARYIMINVL